MACWQNLQLTSECSYKQHIRRHHSTSTIRRKFPWSSYTLPRQLPLFSLTATRCSRATTHCSPTPHQHRMPFENNDQPQRLVPTMGTCRWPSLGLSTWRPNSGVPAAGDVPIIFVFQLGTSVSHVASRRVTPAAAAAGGRSVLRLTAAPVYVVYMEASVCFAQLSDSSACSHSWLASCMCWACTKDDAKATNK